MTKYKTAAGLARAIRATIDTLAAGPIEDQQAYEALSARVGNLFRQCRALWSSPADAEDFGRLAGNLRDAWNRAVLGDRAETY